MEATRPHFHTHDHVNGTRYTHRDGLELDAYLAATGLEEMTIRTCRDEACDLEDDA